MAELEPKKSSIVKDTGGPMAIGKLRKGLEKVGKNKYTRPIALGVAGIGLAAQLSGCGAREFSDAPIERTSITSTENSTSGSLLENPTEVSPQGGNPKPETTTSVSKTTTTIDNANKETTTTETTTKTIEVQEHESSDSWTKITEMSEIDPEVIKHLQELSWAKLTDVKHFLTTDPTDEKKTIGFYVAKAKDEDGGDVRFIARDTDPKLIPLEVLLKVHHEDDKTIVDVTGMIDCVYEYDYLLTFELAGEEFSQKEGEDRDAFMSRTWELVHATFDDEYVAPGLTEKAKKALSESSKLIVQEYKDGEETMVVYDKNHGHGKAIENIVENLYMNESETENAKKEDQTSEKVSPDNLVSITPQSEISQEIVQKLVENGVGGELIDVNHFQAKDSQNAENEIGFYIIKAKHFEEEGEVQRFIAWDGELKPLEVLVKIEHPAGDEFKTNVRVTGITGWDSTDCLLDFELGGEEFSRKGSEDIVAYRGRTWDIIRSTFDSELISGGLTPKGKKVLAESAKLSIFKYGEPQKDEVLAEAGWISTFREETSSITYDSNAGQGKAIESIVNNLFGN